MKKNCDFLGKVFNQLDKVRSYAAAFILRNPTTQTTITLDRHFLVNHDSNQKYILQKIYNRLEELSEKYYFTVEDVMILKLRELHVKVNNLKEINTKEPSIRSPLQNTESYVVRGKSKLFKSDYIPHSMELKYYGIIRKIDKKNNTTDYDNGRVIIRVKIIEEGLHHRISVFSRDNSKLLYLIEDVQYEDGFIRHWIEDDIYLRFDSEHNLVNVEIPQKVGFIEAVGTDLEIDEKILSFDIETYKVPMENGEVKMVAYACAFYDGKKSYTYYLSDYNSEYEMLYACLLDIVKKYNNHTVYCHNFSKFDINFIFKILMEKFKVGKPVSKDLDILSIPVSYQWQEGKGDKIKLVKSRVTIVDSCRIAQGSLRDLAIAFGVETLKLFFPYDYVDKNKINYVGKTPDYKYYVDSQKGAMISLLEWQAMFTNKWSMREERIKYLNNDVIALYQVMMTMNKFIFNNYRVNITSVKTTSALALLIYRTNFLVDLSENYPKNQKIVELNLKEL